MCPYNDYYDDFDDFASERTRARQKLLDDHRREERASRQTRHRNRFKGRRDHVDWDWSEDDDWNSRDLEYYEDLTRRY